MVRFGRPRAVEIAAGGAGATALRRHGAVHRAKAFLLVAVEIVGTRIARLHPGFNHRLEERIVPGFGVVTLTGPSPPW